MSAAAHQRITQLATLTPVHRAFHWLHLHQPQIRQWQLDLVRIPAPPFHEQHRAAWFLDRFRSLGLTNVHLDDEGNALAELAPEIKHPYSLHPPLRPSRHRLPRRHLHRTHRSVPTHRASTAPASATTPPASPLSSPSPPPCATPASTPPVPILFAANVGEEGEGDLRGMRHLFERGPYRDRIAAAIALEGSGTSTVVTRALGSLRFRVTITGPGGHSWSDAGAPNPILLLSRALADIADLPLSSAPVTTLNVGHISGGTSVNSIPASATALLELRSTSTAAPPLRRRRDPPHPRQYTVAAQSASPHPPTLHIETIGNRPAAALPDDSALLSTLRAVDRHLNLPTEPRLGSTDANLPLSLGIPALAIGAGGIGGGIHTLEEWYDPTGRETALRRILLLLLAATQIAPQLSAESSADSAPALHSTA